MLSKNTWIALFVVETEIPQSTAPENAPGALPDFLTLCVAPSIKHMSQGCDPDGMVTFAAISAGGEKT